MKPIISDDEFKSNMSIILCMSLALENYEDNTGERLDYLNKAFEELKILRKTKDLLDDKEKIAKTNYIIDEFNKAFTKIGREKFIFYDDGDINYIWK